MGRVIKVFILIFIILVVALILGMYQIQNDHDIYVDLIYFAEPVQMSVARFAMAFFFGGVLLGIGLCVMICLAMGMELNSARRQTKKLSKELNNFRERSLKEST
jgi:uncharacterized membrane protein YciS (DUF1049 family)